MASLAFDTTTPISSTLRQALMQLNLLQYENDLINAGYDYLNRFDTENLSMKKLIEELKEDVPMKKLHAKVLVLYLFSQQRQPLLSVPAAQESGQEQNNNNLPVAEAIPLSRLYTLQPLLQLPTSILAAADRLKRLKQQLLLIDAGAKSHETIKDYINDMIMDAYVVSVERGSVIENESKESPLFRQLDRTKLFQQLLKVRSILEEYLTAQHRTPNEQAGLQHFWNEYPCTISDYINWLQTKRWDFYCTKKGGIDVKYVENYIKRAFKFCGFLDHIRNNDS